MPLEPATTDAPPPTSAIPGSRAARRNIAVGVHSVVDFFSFIGVSLMPLLAARIDLTSGQQALLLSLGTIASGAIQPLVAWLSDKYDTRVLGTMGMVVAVLCVSNLGFAETFWQLALLHGLGTAGIGAFHPPAAAATGALSTKRAMGMSLFFIAGMVGGMAGNVFAPMYVDVVGGEGPEAASRGLRAMVWFIPVGLAFAGLLAWAIHSVPHRSQAAHEDHRGLDANEQKRRWAAVWLLYACNVLRFSTNLGLVYLFIRLAERITLAGANATEMTEELGVLASERNGPLQAAMQLGMGGFGLVLGAVLTARWEKPAMIVLPFFGAAVIAATPTVSGIGSAGYPLAIGMSVLAGVGFGSLIPVSMSIAQRMIPHRTSLASGLMLGGAWCLAFIGPISAERIEQAAGLDEAFYAISGLIGLAGVLAVFLPGALLRETADE